MDRPIAIIHRLNDNEDKWVACPKNMNFSKEEILEKVNFMEQYFKVFNICWNLDKRYLMI